MTKIIKNATENQTPQDWMNWLTKFGKRPYVLSKDENIALRDAVTNMDKAYERVAHKFFYETLKPMLSGLAFQVLATYKTIVDERDIATIIYRKFWDGGNFSRLKGFKGECSLFSWISIGAAQVVYEDLEEIGIIKKNRNLTPKNTSLRLKSFTDVEELKAVLSLVPEPRWHDILTEIYVNCTSEEDIMKKYKLDETSLKKTIKVAEISLKEQLIETEFLVWHRTVSKREGRDKVVNLVSLALGDVSGNINASTSDEALAIAENRTTDMDIYEELQDVLRLKYPNNSPEEMWNEFVMEQAMKCGMTDEQYDVWKARYIDNESPKSIAERLNMRRSNIDNLYSRGNMVLKEYIRNWLKNNS